MTSTLVITDVDKLQGEISKVVGALKNKTGIYVSLNKTQKSVEKVFKKSGIKTEKIFFIDCVSLEKVREDVLHISPRELDKLEFAIKSFLKEIKGKKFLVIDALSTLLIYNDENKVAGFVKEVTSFSQKDVQIFAFSPVTKGEELLNKIFNFFDEVKKEDSKKDVNKKDLIY